MEQVREIDGEQAYEKMRRAVEKASQVEKEIQVERASQLVSTRSFRRAKAETRRTGAGLWPPAARFLSRAYPTLGVSLFLFSWSAFKLILKLSSFWRVPFHVSLYEFKSRLKAEQVHQDSDPPLQLDLHIRFACGQCVHPGEAKLAGTVYAPKGGFLFAFDDGEGRVNMADVVAVSDAVQMEEHGVKLGAQDQASVFVPGEG